MSEQETEFDAALMLLYELTIANAPFPARDCRDVADKVSSRVGNIRSQVKTILGTLEMIDTTQLAAKGLYEEATAVGNARLQIDRLLGVDPVGLLNAWEAQHERRNGTSK